MFALRAICALAAVLPAFATAPLPQIPVGYEQTSNGYTSQDFRRTLHVDAAGASIEAGGTKLRISLLHSSARAQLTATGNAGTRNEFIGNSPAKWRTGIPLYTRVTARAVYPGVDLVWYSNGSNLEYDFNLQPHADPRQIRLHFSGADRVTLNPTGDIVLSGKEGVILHKLPAAYQIIRGTRHEVAAQFRLTPQNNLSFVLGTYDTAAPLTIDPSLELSSYSGGGSVDEAHAVAIDSTGNFFIAGQTYSTKLGNSNLLLLKIPPSPGTPVSTVFGGTTGTDFASALTLDTSGNVFIVGGTTSTDFPVSGGLAIQNLAFGQQKAFIIGLGANLTSLGFSTWFGGSYTDLANGIALGPNNLLYIVGDTNSVDFLEEATGGSLINTNAFQVANHGGYDGFLLSMTTAGVFNFATYIGGTNDDHAYGVAVDASSNIYVVGGTLSSDFPGYPNSTLEATAFETYHGNGDGFAIKLVSTTGTAIYGSAGEWSIFMGGSNVDVANAVALDAGGNPYVTGTTASDDFPVGGGGYQTTYQGGTSDGFVFALHSDGLHGYWSSYLGSTTADVLNSIAVDTAGNIYVTGASDGSNYPVTSSALQSSNAGGQDVVVTELNNSGTNLLYSTYIGGAADDVGRGIAVDPTGAIYLAGITSSANFPVTTSAPQPAFGGGSSDGFVSILGCSSGVPLISAGGVGNAASYSTTTLSPGGIFAIFGSYFSCVATSASTLPLKTTLNGVTVSVNGTAVPLFYAGEGQINAQLPYGTPVGSATITITAAGGVSAAFSAPVQETGPGIFVVSGQAAALNPDGHLNTSTNGAAVGSYISVYFTGIGPLDNPVATGAAAPASPLSRATQPYSATLGGQPATVAFLGLAPGFVGLGQANILVPNLPAGNYPLILTIGGLASNSGTVTVSN